MSKNVDFCTVNSTLSAHCSSCSYGPLCQFTSEYYGILSLEAFLCSIKPIPTSIFICILLIGTLCNLLAIGTFCQSNAREMGSGIYRLWISIVGQLGLTVVIIHIILEKNNSGRISCFIFEYLRKVLHAL
jgi:hypothetical protein